MWAQEFHELIGQEALLQGYDDDGRSFIINNLPFVVETGNVPLAKGVANVVTDIRFTPEEKSGVKRKTARGVMVVGNGAFVDIQDLWVDHVFIRLRVDTDKGPACQFQDLHPHKPWPKRGGDYVGGREYDMLVADLAGRLKPVLKQQAQDRIEHKREMARLRAEAEAAELASIRLTREDLEEANANWGMF